MKTTIDAISLTPPYQALNSPKGQRGSPSYRTHHIPVTLFAFSPDRLLNNPRWVARPSDTLTFDLPYVNRVTLLCASRLTYPAHHFAPTGSHTSYPVPRSTYPDHPPYLTLHLPCLNRVTHLCELRSQVPLTFLPLTRAETCSQTTYPAQGLGHFLTI